MIINKISKRISELAIKKRSIFYKALSLLVGAVFFMAILPFLFILVGVQVQKYFSINLNIQVSIILAIFSIVFGLYFLIWATGTQLRIGKGTPAPNAPTQKLIIAGPYKLCRNPIQLGAIFYYLGVGTLFRSFTVGLVSMLLGMIIGSTYHKMIEEKELAIRFGAEYIKYKQNTSFICPKIRKRNTI